MDNSYGKLIAPETLQFERLLPGPIERVWKYLTDSELRGKWLAAGEMNLIPGGHVQLNFHNEALSREHDPAPEKYSDQVGIIETTGQVVSCNPPSHLCFIWGSEGEVTIDLTEEGEKVRLLLTHRKLAKDKEIRIGISAGWHTHLNILEEVLNGKEPGGFWTAHMKKEEEYAKLY